MLLSTLDINWMFLNRVGDAAARSLLLASVTALVLAALRIKSIWVKLIVWRCVLIAVVAMPILGLFTPKISVRLPLPALMGSQTLDVSAQGFKLKKILSPKRNIAVLERITAPQLVTHSNATSTRSLHGNAEEPHKIRWSIVLTSVYVAATFFFLARLLIGIHLGKRLDRSAQKIEHRSLLHLLRTCSRKSKLKLIPRISVSETLSVPVTFGVRDPVILLPSNWDKWENVELAAVLVHEISHVARRDALVQRLALVHRAIFWFSPLAWWLERYLGDLAEQASDEAALVEGANRIRYAETLLGFFAALETRSQRVWWEGVSMAKAGQAEKASASGPFLLLRNGLKDIAALLTCELELQLNRTPKYTLLLGREPNFHWRGAKILLEHTWKCIPLGSVPINALLVILRLPSLNGSVPFYERRSGFRVLVV